MSLPQRIWAFPSETKFKDHQIRSRQVLSGADLFILNTIIQIAYTVSCIPWVKFEHFAVHSYENKDYYFPSVEAGKIFPEGEKELLPLSLTCHHAAVDGYHISRFLEELQKDIDSFEV